VSDLRYAVYLRPSYEMSRAQAEVHDVLARQYGLRAAGNFMPHATIKGFFRSEASEGSIAACVDAVLDNREAFDVFNGGIVAFGRYGIAIDVNGTPERRTPNVPLQDLHRTVMDAVMPLVDPACEFTREETELAAYERFRAHLTLAMADVPEHLFDEVLAFVREADPIGPPSFLADTVQFLAFRSDDWGGRWWETLRWQLLRSWTLAAS
jgi:2'-5' RNA ligase superfamily